MPFFSALYCAVVLNSAFNSSNSHCRISLLTQYTALQQCSTLSNFWEYITIWLIMTMRLIATQETELLWLGSEIIRCLWRRWRPSSLPRTCVAHEGQGWRPAHHYSDIHTHTHTHPLTRRAWPFTHTYTSSAVSAMSWVHTHRSQDSHHNIISELNHTPLSPNSLPHLIKTKKQNTGLSIWHTSLDVATVWLTTTSHITI